MPRIAKYDPKTDEEVREIAKQRRNARVGENLYITARKNAAYFTRIYHKGKQKAKVIGPISEVTLAEAIEIAKKRKKEAEMTSIPTQTIRPLSLEEKRKIRHELDKHFDEEVGRYSEGYSDQRVGQEIGMPWAFVTAYRESEYGPIRTDTELDNFEAELRTVRELLQNLENRFNQMKKQRGM